MSTDNEAQAVSPETTASETDQAQPSADPSPPAEKTVAAKPVSAEVPEAKAGLRAELASVAREWRQVRSDTKPIVPRGNRLRPLRGGGVAIVAGLVAFCLMATEQQFRWGVPAGILATVACALGILDFLGTFGDPEERVAKRTKLGDLGVPLGLVTLALGVTLGLITVAVAGKLPILASALLIPAAFLGLVVAVYNLGVVLGPWATDETGETRPIYRRHGFWVVATGTLLYLPMLGSYSLSDPWETHYGEVAREMLARNDWISTWWAQDGWFWSKPVLDFWMQALSMGVFGVKYLPDKMLEGAHAGQTPWPEWAIRMPVFILTILALYFLYKGVAHMFGRRAGLLGALVLASMPQWFLLAHQSITDMPLVACLSASMGLLILGMHTDPDKTAPAYEVDVFGRKLRLSAYHLVLVAILASALPQILYLASRNAELVWQAGARGFRVHLDTFSSGSKFNCGLPGNEACNPQKPFNVDFQPFLQGLMWLGAVLAILWLNRGERRVQRLCFLAAWFFAAVATLGKGPAGFGLPVLVACTYVATTRKWSKLLQLEIPSGLLIIAVVAIPWYLAMYLRHGPPFTDRLIFHDMWKRAMTHVHDTNEGDDVSFRFFIWQLGYALFPWVGLVPAGLAFWLRRRDDAASGKGDVSVFLGVWFVFAFALFTAMLTKFHHYIFPAVPPAAMLTGIMLDRMLGEGRLARTGRTLHYVVSMGAGALVTLLGATLLFPGWFTGYRADNVPPDAHSKVLALLLVALGAAGTVLAAHRFGRGAVADEPAGDDDHVDGEAAAEADDLVVRRRRIRHENLLLGGVGVAAAIVVALVGRDMTWKTEASDVTGQARLIYLFTYNYRRPWPESIEFTGTILAFTLVATLLCVLLLVERWRRHVIAALTAASLLWAAWGVDIYLVKASPHWGQRELLEAYYQHRERPDYPVVAYQMNWKGENFYTGNHIPAFVSSGASFTNWIKGQNDKGIKTIYFVTEHSRTGSLRSEAGNPKSFDMLTDKRVNNKFVLVRARYD